jgi:hypothetical protein
LAFPLHAQTADTGAARGTSSTMTADSARTATTAPREEEHHFPWGLLGLLGLAGLMKRPQRETVVEREPVYRDPAAKGRPGDPNYRA